MKKKNQKNPKQLPPRSLLFFLKSQTLETLFQELIFTCDSKDFILKLSSAVAIPFWTHWPENYSRIPIVACSMHRVFHI